MSSLATPHRSARFAVGVRWAVALALLASGFPLARAWWPSGPLPAAAPDDQEVGEIVVDAKDTLTAQQLADLNAKYGVSLNYNSPEATDEKLLIAEVPPDEETALLERLRKDPLVEAAEPMRRVQLNWTPNDPRFSEQWNLKQIGAEKAWDKATGKGVVVAVIDTGVAFENDEKCYRAKDFADTAFVPGYDFIHNDTHPNDDHGHGTHVAGTIAESTNNGEGVAGLAFNAKIMPLKVLSSSGSGRSSDIADAIRFAADHGAKIINMSLGGPFPDPVTRSACQYAVKKGVLIVCAAGNSGGGRVGYPAAFPECLAVSAVGPTGEIAPYSSVGRQVGIAAPGGDKTNDPAGGILQNTVLYDADGEREDDYFAFQGTSMASPHVAAAAALVMSRGITDPAEVRQILEKSATSKKPATKYGAGLLNAAKAVDLTETDRRDSLFRLLFAILVGVGGMTYGFLRGGLRGLTQITWLPLGFVLGVLGPDMVFGWLGFGSAFNVVLHSALVPLFLLSAAESKSVNRFVSVLALGVAVHLGWDAYHGHVPFGGILPDHALPWLWTNTVVAAGTAGVAWVRALSRP